MVDLFHKQYAPPGSAPDELRPSTAASQTMVHALLYDAQAIRHDGHGLPQPPARRAALAPTDWRMPCWMRWSIMPFRCSRRSASASRTSKPTCWITRDRMPCTRCTA